MIGQVQCSRCNAWNRAGAKFCSNCRASLTTPSPTKICSNCRAPNRADAKFCATCRHQFASAPIPRRLILSGAVFAGVVVLTLICGLGFWAVTSALPTPSARSSPLPTSMAAANTVVPATGTVANRPSETPATPAPVPTTASAVLAADGIERAERATVQVWVLFDPRGNSGKKGSGTIITKAGHILTNNHLFFDANGKPVDTRNGILVAVPPGDNMSANAQVRFRAVLVQADAKNDLALIRIVADSDNKSLPADLDIVVATIGDSDTAKIGDSVAALGFPGIGGNSLTLTRGVISGFLLDEGFIKTDAEINEGNSGGGAYNAMYTLIGVTTMIVTPRNSTGKVGLIRPIKIAKPLIDLAKQQAGE